MVARINSRPCPGGCSLSFSSCSLSLPDGILNPFLLCLFFLRNTITAGTFSIHLCHRSDQIRSVAQSCPTLCDPMDCSLPGSSIHGIFQARILEWVAVSFSRGSSRPRDWTQVSLTVARCFTIWATREVQELNFLSWWHSREKTQITLGDKMQARITKEQELWARCGHRT